MAKQKALLKQLIRLSIIMLMATAMLGAGAVFVYSTATSIEQEMRTSESKLNKAMRDITAREEKAKQAEEYMELYRSIQAQKNGDSVAALDREVAQNWALDAGKQMNLSRLDGSFEPVKPIASPAFKKDTLEGISSRANLTFGAMTDEQIYKFMAAIANHFPGFIKFESLKLFKTGTIDDSVLRQISSGEKPVLVDGELIFHWVGVREAVQEEANAGTANARR